MEVIAIAADYTGRNALSHGGDLLRDVGQHGTGHQLLDSQNLVAFLVSRLPDLSKLATTKQNEG